MLNPFSNRKVLRRGEPARARILDMGRPLHGPNASKVMMTLEVAREDGPHYEIHDRWMISGTEPIGPGSELCVVVDPENRHRLAIDWDRTRAEFRERSEKRRQMLPVGVPVPVSKVREVAEDIGYKPWTKPARSGEAVTPAPEEGLAEAPSATPEIQPSVDGEDLIAKLERLSSLHVAGSLTDGEFEAAKQHVLAAL